MTSQVSFLIALILADFITLSYINWYYIKDKTVTSDEPPAEIEIEEQKN
jgi:hypothetical protein